MKLRKPGKMATAACHYEEEEDTFPEKTLAQEMLREARGSDIQEYKKGGQIVKTKKVKPKSKQTL
jgi:hypothetical protein